MRGLQGVRLERTSKRALLDTVLDEGLTRYSEAAAWARPVIHLDITDLLHIADRVLPDVVVRDGGMLESALARPGAKLFGVAAYPDLQPTRTCTPRLRPCCTRWHQVEDSWTATSASPWRR